MSASDKILGLKRRRTFGFIALVLGSVSFLALATHGCSSNPGPPAALTVVNASDLGTIPTNPDILGRDGGFSALFQGYSVWLYGDTFLANPNADGRGLISDSWSYTTDLNAQDGITGFQERLDPAGAPSMILPETAAEYAFNQAHNGNPCQTQPCGARWALWPSTVVSDTANNRALVFYGVVYALPGSFNFQGLGSSVAVWQDFNQQPQRPRFNPAVVAGHSDLMFNQNEPGFGTAAFISAGTLYIYGCGVPANSADKGCRLAKVDPGSVLDPSAWTYYARSGNWSSQLSDAVSVIPDVNIMSVSWNSYLQQYVAVYSQLFSQNVMMRTSPNPEGPWSREVTAFVAQQPASGNVYDAHAHAEYDANGGQTIYVTYSRGTGAFTSEVRLVAVQLKRP
ncbi:MAG TPA: DUF4185 domain-containing protein [Candidatus Acidoferrales bacterium]|nr:DUF4185 domain-containing protein [Candidatus Acidoferrales bacterium]